MRVIIPVKQGDQFGAAQDGIFEGVNVISVFLHYGGSDSSLPQAQSSGAMESHFDQGRYWE